LYRRGRGFLSPAKGRGGLTLLAEELGINILYGGHYATEAFGVKALAEHLFYKFRVPWTFMEHR
jgi:putative NIF3 family GTP cyclohydrolase 1 type 2